MLRVGRDFGETLGDEPVETVEPVIAHRVAFEKRVVLRSRQCNKAAVRQQSGGPARCRGGDDPRVPAADQDRGLDRGEKFRFRNARDQGQRAVDPAIGRLVQPQPGSAENQA